MKFNFPVLALSLLALSASAHAEVVQQRHACSKPIRPISTDQFSKQSYVDEIVRYADCLKGFASEHESAAVDHAKAAKMARDEWDSFMDEEPLLRAMPRKRQN